MSDRDSFICHEQFGDDDMTCRECERLRADVERYKLSAGMWRNKCYELGGTPLPWEPEELIQKAVEAEREACANTDYAQMPKMKALLINIRHDYECCLESICKLPLLSSLTPIDQQKQSSHFLLRLKQINYVLGYTNEF